MRDIPELNRSPFLWDKIDKEDIQSRINMIRPDNMFVIFSSKLNKKLKDVDPKKLETEKWYNTQFMAENFESSFLSELNSIKKPDDLKMGYPEPNKFIPQNLATSDKFTTSFKTPTNILSEQGINMFYKQDSKFKQPMVGIRCKITTDEMGYPNTPESRIFA